MKRIILFFVFSLYFGNVFAQQEVNFVNNSGYDIYISYIVTTDRNDMTGNQQPQLASSSNGIVVPAGTTYSAEDSSTQSPYRFPYNDFAGINQWNAQGISLTPTQAYISYGPDQKFYFAKVVVNDPSIGDGGSIGQNFGQSQSYIPGTYVDFFFSEIQPDPNDPTFVIYNILAL